MVSKSTKEGGERNEEGDVRNVLVELRIPNVAKFVATGAQELDVPSFKLDKSYNPVPIKSRPGAVGAFNFADEQVVIIRGTIESSKIPELEAQENVVKVWNDTRIAPFRAILSDKEQSKILLNRESRYDSAEVYDCASDTAKGTIADVATYLGVSQIWTEGCRGEGIVVGVVDGGVTAQGRSINSIDSSDPRWPKKLIPRVIGGWPTEDWGTTGQAWDWHGNMCSTDVLGMAPNAQIYDIRISGNDTKAIISAALAGFQWAIDQHRLDGTPHILTNSWGIYQENWDTEYASNQNHPFTRKVIEAINEGIIVLFAAGNCGNTCPDVRCGTDKGPGKSIWGANSHGAVITVGAVNINEEYVGYSSQGPGALSPNKPDFCSVTHFQGFFDSDSGTSAATPIAAGVVALLKQANPSLSQSETKEILITTSKAVGAEGWNQSFGAGIIQGKLAYDRALSIRSKG